MKKLITFKILILATLFFSCSKDAGDDLRHRLGETGEKEITAYLDATFPGSRIFDIDIEYSFIEVEIVHDHKSKDVFFNNSSYAWMSTEWDVSYQDLPQAVKDAIKDSAYSNFRIDDAEYVQTPTQNYYQLELEQGETEVTIRFAEDGEIVK